MSRDRKLKGIRVKGSNGSDYMLSIIDIARDKAKSMSSGGKNPDVIVATSILPEFEKNPEKVREWAKKMKPDNMRFIKVKTADEPTSEELAKSVDSGVVEVL